MSSLEDEQSIFANALELTAADRGAYLEIACAGEPALLARIERLLAAHERAVGFLAEEPVAGVDVETVTSSLPVEASTRDWSTSAAIPASGSSAREAKGQVIGGKYTLVEPLGEGGMGSVWRAKQTEPVKRFVAVKLIKAGMDSRQVLARFEAERQALAIMDHPSIAKIHDAGVAADGRPFFVMELVKGVPITDFCDERRLAPHQRLELFIPVCEAVQHAHQKGVIHRDIKPSNVLIALYDGRPIPKVIDFGMAKATENDLAEQIFQTSPGVVVGTPAYMAPEQAELDNRDIDTRVDVYGLGALLYELLAGSPPFSRAQLHRAGLLEMLRVVREEEPVRPSDRLSTSDILPSLAAARAMEPRQLAGLLRSDLDWVVMKALEKDRSRRYETASGLADDVRHYLTGEPVGAAPPSLRYRMRKFIQRNRTTVAVAATLVFLLILGTVGTTVGMVEAEHQKKIAQDLAKSAKERADEATVLIGLQQGLLESFNPATAKGTDYTFIRPLEEYEQALAGKFDGRPEVEADFRRAIGQSFAALDKHDQAVKQFQMVVSLRRAAPGTDPRKLAQALMDLAYAYTAVTGVGGQAPTVEEFLTSAARSRPLAEEALALLRGKDTGSDEDLANALIAYGAAIWVRGGGHFLPDLNANAASEAALLEGIETARRCPEGRMPRSLPDAHLLLSEHYRVFHDNFAKSLEHAKAAITLLHKAHGSAHFRIAGAIIALGASYLAYGDYARAEEQFRQALTMSRAVFGSRTHPQSSVALRQLVFALAMQYKDEEIEAILKALPPEWHADSFQFRLGASIPQVWGDASYCRGDYAEAVRHYRESMTAWKTAPGEFQHEMEQLMPDVLAAALALQDKNAEAQYELRDLFPIAQNFAKEASTEVDYNKPQGVRFFHAEILLIAGRRDRDSLLAVKKLTGPLNQFIGLPVAKKQTPLLLNLIACYYLEEYDTVIQYCPVFLGAVSARGADLVFARFMEKCLVESLEKTDKLQEAEQALRKAVKVCDGKFGSGHPEVSTRQVLLAEFLTRRKRYEEAAKQFESAYHLLAHHPQASGRSLTRRRAEVVGLMAAMIAVWEKENPIAAAQWRAWPPLLQAPPPRPVPP